MGLGRCVVTHNLYNNEKKISCTVVFKLSLIDLLQRDSRYKSKV